MKKIKFNAGNITIAIAIFMIAYGALSYLLH